ncbi:DsrE family protein [Alkalimonas delamerensis]|uniref:DsrE family protein n=1 Tax=Alkalimonas delamerensis TaxID=265981 RepID=A0ABT9GPI4_9GAMM|nr:DsrE family protein [Alkalimonas delamerensis]MDP4528888.1 DsrE family protein [Alkalimonas delamerensis]
MTTFALLLTESPLGGQAFQSCLRFARSAIETGHSIDHVFLYRDAVLAASPDIDLPSDEPNVAGLLADFCQAQQIPLLFCSTAAEKRGLSLVTFTTAQSKPQSYQLAGLAEHAMRLDGCDKVIQF